MNHCRDCNSDYATPGTCNCFAPGGKRSTAPTPAYPYHPWWVQPWYPYSPYYPWTYTITGGSIGLTGLTVASGTITADIDQAFNVSGNSVRADQVTAPWSYTSTINS